MTMTLVGMMLMKHLQHSKMGGQPTVNELKELNLGTTEEPKPILASTLSKRSEENKYYALESEYKDVFA